MNSDTLLIALTLGLGFGLIIWFLNHKLSQSNKKADPIIAEWLQSTQRDIKELQNQLTTTLQQSDKNVTDTLQKSYQELNLRLDSAAKVIGELKTETGKFTEIGRSMKELQAFLQSPKIRGNLGEQVLKDLLSQMLPKQAFDTQYRFESGAIVDAVIKTRAGLICIDSKFPLENYVKMSTSSSDKERLSHQKQFGQDLKKHIRDIHTKYIETQSGTLDFALMYIPSESIYYEIMTNQPTIYDHALTQRVLPVSPSTFYAFLQTVLVSFEGQRIAKEAQTILTSLRDIQKTSTDFSDKLQVLSRHITNAYNNMSSVTTDFGSLQQKIESTRKISLEDSQIPTEIEA
jgi:DNA recombination protein RmuC